MENETVIKATMSVDISNLDEVHARCKTIKDDVRSIKADFSAMPNLSGILNNNLERTVGLANDVERKFQAIEKTSASVDSDEYKNLAYRTHQNALDLQARHQLQKGGAQFSAEYAQNFAASLPLAIANALDKTAPAIANILNSRLSGFARKGSKSHIYTSADSVRSFARTMLNDKDIMSIVSRAGASASREQLTDYFEILAANVVPMYQLNEYSKLRYGKAVNRENSRIIKDPVSQLPPSFRKAFRDHSYQKRQIDDAAATQVLTQESLKFLGRLLETNGVATRAALSSGIAMRNPRGALNMRQNISRADYESFRQSLFDEFVRRTGGMNEYYLADIFDPRVAETVAKRMSGSSSAGNTVRAMNELERLEASVAWGAAGQNNRKYIRLEREGKRLRDMYSIKRFNLFDPHAQKEQNVAITESSNTRLLGLNKRGHNSDASDVVAYISLSGYDETNKSHEEQLKTILSKGIKLPGADGKSRHFSFQSMKRDEQGARLILVNTKAMREVDKQLRPLADQLGLSGSYWSNYENTKRFPSEVNYRKNLDARNKGWTPSDEIGNFLANKKIAVVNFEEQYPDGSKVNYNDGIGWLPGLRHPIQFRGGVALKGTLRRLPGENNRDFAIRSGLATLGEDGEHHWYVKGANDKEGMFDIIDYDGFVDASVIKNMNAYKKNGKMMSNAEISELFTRTFLINPLAEAKDFELASMDADSIGVQMMSYMKLGPALMMNQLRGFKQRLQELGTEAGVRKYVFPASNKDALSIAINTPGNEQMIQSNEVRNRVDSYINELSRKISTGEYVDFSDSPEDSLSYKELSGSPLVGFLRQNGLNENIMNIARDAIKKGLKLSDDEFNEQYTDDVLEQILLLKSGNAIDFLHEDVRKEAFLRSPTGFGDYVVATNRAKEWRFIHEALAKNIPEGLDPNSFSNAFLEGKNIILGSEDLYRLSGADLDADAVKIATNPEIVQMIEDSIAWFEQIKSQFGHIENLKTVEAARKNVADDIDSRMAAAVALTKEVMAIGGAAASIRGHQFDLTDPLNNIYALASIQGRDEYDIATTKWKKLGTVEHGKGYWKAARAGREFTKFTDNLDALFRYDADMIDSQTGQPIVGHEDLYFDEATGQVINLRPFRGSLNLLNTNLPSMYMDNHVKALMTSSSMYKLGMVDPTRATAISNALNYGFDAIYKEEKYGKLGDKTKTFIKAMDSLYPQFAIGQRSQLTQEESDSLEVAYNDFRLEIEDMVDAKQREQGLVGTGMVRDESGKLVGRNLLVDTYLSKLGENRYLNFRDKFGFTEERIQSELSKNENFQDVSSFFENSADASLPAVVNTNVSKAVKAVDQESKSAAEQASKQVAVAAQESATKTAEAINEQIQKPAATNEQVDHYEPAAPEEHSFSYADDGRIDPYATLLDQMFTKHATADQLRAVGETLLSDMMATSAQFFGDQFKNTDQTMAEKYFGIANGRRAKQEQAFANLQELFAKHGDLNSSPLWSQIRRANNAMNENYFTGTAKWSENTGTKILEDLKKAVFGVGDEFDKQLARIEAYKKSIEELESIINEFKESRNNALLPEDQAVVTGLQAQVIEAQAVAAEGERKIIADNDDYALKRAQSIENQILKKSGTVRQRAVIEVAQAQEAIDKELRRLSEGSKKGLISNSAYAEAKKKNESLLSYVENEMLDNLIKKDIGKESYRIGRITDSTNSYVRRTERLQGRQGTAWEQRIFEYEDRLRQFEENSALLQDELTKKRDELLDVQANPNSTSAEIKAVEEDINKLTAAYAANEAAANKLRGTNIKVAAGWSVLGETTSRALAQFGRQMFQRAINEAQRFVVAFDSAMTEIQMVTLKTDKEIGALGDSLIEKAVELKASVGEVTSAATSLYRQGLSDEEVDSRLTGAIQFSKTAKIKPEDAIKLATVALNNGGVSSADTVFDIVSALGDSAATDASQIAKGLTRSYAMAGSMEVSFEDMVAMLTAITSKTQLSGSVAGTTMRNVLSRISRFGDPDSQYAPEVQLLRNAGIDIYKGSELQGITQILANISEKWEQFDDRQQADIAYALGGTEQYSNVMALIQGFADADIQKYLNIASGADGVMNEKYLHYLDSLEGSLTNLQTTFDKLVESAGGTDVVVGFLDFVSGGLEGIADVNEALDGTLTTVTSLSVAVAALISLWKISKGSIITMAAIAGVLAVGNVAKNIIDNNKTPSIADQRTTINNSYAKTESRLKEAQSINQRRIDNSGTTLTDSEMSALKKTLSQLYVAGDFSFDGLKTSTGDAITSIDQLATEAGATADALKQATDSIIQSKDNANHRLAIAAINKVDSSKRDYVDYITPKYSSLGSFFVANETVDGEYIRKFDSLQTQMSEDAKNETITNTSLLMDFFNALVDVGALDAVQLGDGKLFSSLAGKDGKYSLEEKSNTYRRLISGQLSPVYDAIFKMVSDPSTLQPYLPKDTTFGEFNRSNINAAISGYSGIAGTGFERLMEDIAVEELSSMYLQDSESVNFGAYLQNIVDTGLESYIKERRPDEYAAIRKSGGGSSADADAFTQIGQYATSTATKQANYSDVYERLFAVYNNAMALKQNPFEAVAMQLASEKHPNLFIEADKDFANLWYGATEYDEGLEKYISKSSLKQSDYEELGRILAQGSSRTQTMGAYASTVDKIRNAKSFIDTVLASGNRRNAWEDTYATPEATLSNQQNVIDILGQDIVDAMLNRSISDEEINKQISRKLTLAKIPVSDHQSDVVSMVESLMGSSSAQIGVAGDVERRILDFSKAYDAYQHIANKSGRAEHYESLASVIRSDSQVLENTMQTNEGRAQVFSSLQTMANEYVSILSDALQAIMPSSAQVAFMKDVSPMTQNAILKHSALDITSVDIIKRIIDSAGLTYSDGSFIGTLPFTHDGRSTPWNVIDADSRKYDATNASESIKNMLMRAVDEHFSDGVGYQEYLDSTINYADWDTFFSKNPLLSAAFSHGGLDRRAMEALINQSVYGLEKSPEFYDVGASYLLGEDYENGDWASMLTNYEAVRDTQLGSAFIDDMSDVEEFTELINLLNEALAGHEVSTEQSTSVTKNFVNELGARAVAKINAHKKNVGAMTTSYKDLAKEGSDAIKILTSLRNRVEDLNNQKWAIGQYQAGNRSDQVTGIMSDLLEVDEADIKKATEDQAQYFVDAAKISVDDMQSQLDSEIDLSATSMYNKVANQLFDQSGQVINLGDYLTVEGNIDFSSIYNNLGDGTSALGRTFVQAMNIIASMGATFAMQATDNADGTFTIDTNLTGITGAKGFSGGGRSGGGGSKKSSAEKLIERIGHGRDLYEHQIKMVQYEQTRYQNADELGNYGKMLQEQIKIERAYLPVLEENIRALESELANVEEGTEDWYRLRDAILEAEEMYKDITNSITENTKKLEENEQTILRLRTDLEDMVVSEIELRLQAEKDQLAGSVSMQDTILSAIKQRYQDEWDLIKRDIEKKKEALQEEKDLIDERLDARREAEDEAAKYEELSELKKQLSLISMDSTRTKDAAALRESIAELEKEIGWDIAEKQAESEKNALQDQIDAYDDYVTKGDEDLEELLEDANNFSEEVNKVLALSQSELFDWLKQNVKEYSNSLSDAQTQMVQSWEDTYKQMLGITDTYWKEVNLILRSKDSFLNYMKQSNEYIYASDDEREQLLYQWEQAYVKWRKAQIKDAEYDHDDDGLGGTKGDEYDDDGGKGGSSGGSGGSSGGNTGGSGGSGGGTQTNTPPYTVYDSDRKSYGTFQSYTEAATVARSVSERVGGKIIIKDKNGKTIGSYGGVSGGSGGTTQNLPETGWPSWLSSTSDHGYWWKVTQNGKNVAVASESVSSREEAQRLGAIEAKKYAGGKYQTKYFLHGGLADFTGPAWLDGSPSAPERILSADQTRNFETLVSIMDDFRNSGITMSALRDMAKWSTMITVPSALSYIGDSAYQGSTSSIGDIFVNITEAQINDDRDIEELANIVGQKFVKEISKQGFNTARYHF